MIKQGYIIFPPSATPTLPSPTKKLREIKIGKIMKMKKNICQSGSDYYNA